MDIEGVGEQFVRKLWDEGLLRSMPDLYRLTAEQLLEVEGYGEISATRAIDAIERSKAQPFSRVLFGLNMPKVGWVLARNLARHFGNVDALMAATQEELEEAEGIGPDRAELIAEWFSDEENRVLVNDLRLLGLQFEVGEADRPVEGPLTGHQYVITGTLEGFSREEAKAALEALGAKVSDSVSKKTTGVDRRREPGVEGREGREGGCADPGRVGPPAVCSPRARSATPTRLSGCRRRRQDRDEPVLRCAGRPGGDRAAVLEHGERRRARDHARRACTRGRSCPSFPSPCRGGPAAGCSACRSCPATASDPTKASRTSGSVAPARITPTSASAVRRSRLERPEPSTMRTPPTGMPGLAHRRDHDPAAADGRPDPARRGDQLLEEHLGIEVVALVVHPPDDLRQGVGHVRCEGDGGVRRDAEARSSRDRDAVPRQRIPERPRSEKRRGEGRPPLGAIDDEGRQRRGLAADEVALPPCRATLCVVERLVAEHPPVHRPDPSPANRRGEAIDVCRGERRVAEPLQDQVTVPRLAGPSSRRRRPPCGTDTPRPAG